MFPIFKYKFSKISSDIKSTKYSFDPQ